MSDTPDRFAGRTPDALRVPRGMALNKGILPQEYIRRRWGKAIGVTPPGRVWCFNQTEYNFCLPDPKGGNVAPHPAELFVKTHPRHPEERYEWVEQPDGTSLGYLKDGCHPTDPHQDELEDGTAHAVPRPLTPAEQRAAQEATVNKLLVMGVFTQEEADVKLAQIAASFAAPATS